jgi:hypothetical protein
MFANTFLLQPFSVADLIVFLQILIREPLDFDFVVDSRPPTPKEKKAISDFIKADKLKRVGAKTGLAKRISFTSAKKSKSRW